MITYYTATIILCLMTLCALMVLVYENGRIPRKTRSLLYLTCLLIAIAAAAEWSGVMIDGKLEYPVWMLKTVKCLDYIFTPLAGGALVLMTEPKKLWKIFMYILLGANVVLQVVSAFNGWMINIDAHNHYTHGWLFPVYFGLCLVTYAMIILQFIIYGTSFKKQNRGSLYAIMLLVFVGIFMQEQMEGVRTAYLGMTFGAALLFIYYSEFSQLARDDYIVRQQIALDTDPLTKLYSRYAYTQALNAFSDAGKLPRFAAAFVMDINGLKQVNDTLGHEAGDEMIRAAGECIGNVFREYGKCFRTGGDEFVVLAAGVDRGRAADALQKLQKETKKWRGKNGHELSLVAGCALADPTTDDRGLTAEELVKAADLKMCEAKARYYQMSGHERRQSGNAVEKNTEQ